MATMPLELLARLPDGEPVAIGTLHVTINAHISDDGTVKATITPDLQQQIADVFIHINPRTPDAPTTH